MDVESRNHQSICQPAQYPNAYGDEDSNDHSANTTSRPILRQDQRPTNRCKRVGSSDRKIDSCGDNDNGHADCHDRKETRVLRNLDKRPRIKELIDSFKGRNLLSIRGRLEDPFRFTFRIVLKLWQLNRSAKNGE